MHDVNGIFCVVHPIYRSILGSRTLGCSDNKVLGRAPWSRLDPGEALVMLVDTPWDMSLSEGIGREEVAEVMREYMNKSQRGWGLA